MRGIEPRSIPRLTAPSTRVSSVSPEAELVRFGGDLAVCFSRLLPRPLGKKASPGGLTITASGTVNAGSLYEDDLRE